MAARARASEANFNPPTPCGVGPSGGLQMQATARFHSTHPVWGGTCSDCQKPIADVISIHPPRVGWDPARTQPGPPGERFQSTHPVWGGTTKISISITNSSDFNPPTPCGVGQIKRIAHAWGEPFQSTHPVWGGTISAPICLFNSVFQSTHPVWGGTPYPAPAGPTQGISIHPPRVGWDEIPQMDD